MLNNLKIRSKLVLLVGSLILFIVAVGAIGEQAFSLAEADTCCAPGFTSVRLHNRQADKPSFLFLADESPLHRKLGVYESRG